VLVCGHLDESVDGPEPRRREFDQCGAGVGLGDVGRAICDPLTSWVELARTVGEPLSVPCTQNDPRTLPERARSTFAAEAGSHSGDGDRLAVENAHGASRTRSTLPR